MKDFNRCFDIIETSVANMVKAIIEKVPFGLHNTVEPVWLDESWGFTVLGETLNVSNAIWGNDHQDHIIEKTCDFTQLPIAEQKTFVNCFNANIDNIITKSLEEQCSQCYDIMLNNEVTAYNSYSDLIHIKGKQLAKMKGIEWHWQKAKELSIEDPNLGSALIFCGKSVTLTIEPKSLVLTVENTFIKGDIKDQGTKEIIYKDATIRLDEASIYLLDHIVERLNTLIREGEQ